MSILDSKREYYFLKWTKKYSDAKIMDESDNTIGEIKHSGRLIDKWKLFDDDNSIILTAYKASWRSKITIKNVDENILGFVSHKLLTLKTILENENKEVILVLQTAKGSDYEITVPQGRKVAECITEKDDRFFCVLKILDQTFDRKLLLGFVIAIIDPVFFTYSANGAGAW